MAAQLTATKALSLRGLFLCFLFGPAPALASGDAIADAGGGAGDHSRPCNSS
jgi:hypothetical protein